MSILMATVRSLRVCAYFALDSVCRIFPRAHRHTTVVVRLDALGDHFIWMRSGATEISEFARASGGRAVLVGNQSWAAYARMTGLWDEVVGIEPRRLMRDPIYRVTMLLRVRGLGAETLIQSRAARVFLQEDSLAWVAGARLRIGNAGTLTNITPALRRFGNSFYNRLITVDEARSTHEIVRNAQFVSGLTGRQPRAGDIRLPARVVADPDALAVALGAGQSGRVWPLEKLAALLRHVRGAHPALKLYLLGMPSDREMARRLEALVGGDIANLVGATTVPEFVGRVAGARLVICNESSAFHIAVAFGTPVLCLLGGGHYGRFAPYPDSAGVRRAIALSVSMDCFGCNWECRYPREASGAMRCVAAIPVDAAVSAVEQLLAP